MLCQNIKNAPPNGISLQYSEGTTKENKKHGTTRDIDAILSSGSVNSSIVVFLG